MSGIASRCPKCHGTLFTSEGTCTGCGEMYIAENFEQRDADNHYARTCGHMEICQDPLPMRRTRLNVSELIAQLPARCEQDFLTGRIGSLEMYMVHYNLVRDNFTKNNVQHFYVNNVGKCANDFQCYASHLPTHGCYDGMRITVPVY